MKRQPSDLPLEERKYRLDVEKHARERLWREDARETQIVTWLLTSQALMGGAFAYLRAQALDAMQRNWSYRWIQLNEFIAWFPLAQLALSLILVMSLWSVHRCQSAIRVEYPDLFKKDSWFASQGPIAATVMLVFIQVMWFVPAAKGIFAW